MLVFVIPSSYPNNVNPQANIFVHEQCVALKKVGCEIVVLDATSFKWKYWFDKTCYKNYVHEKDDVTIYSRHIPSLLKNRLFRLATVQFRFAIKKLFKSAVKDYGIPDLIYAHFTYPSGYVSCELAEEYGVPFMVMEHGGIYMRQKVHPYLKKMLKETVNKSNLFACVSEAQRKYLYECSKTDKSIKIINNMIDDRFKYYPLQNHDKFVFFSAGNLYKVKRMDLLIEAFISAFSADEEVYLEIAGDGIQRQLLDDLIKKHNRELQITLLGRLSRDEILEKYIDCNAFALVSEHESFGIVYREAMAVGRPVISSDNGGISTGWKDIYGKIVPQNNKQVLSSALRGVYDNYSSYDLKTISDNCLKNFSSKNVSENIMKEIKRIVEVDN